MYRARHLKYTRHRVTLPMLVFIALLSVVILIFPTSAAGTAPEPDAVSGARSELAASSAGAYSILTSARRGGAVNTSVSDALAGSTISFSVSPDDGWEVASVEVISASGTSLQLVRIDGDSFKFVMPGSGVVINADFQYARTA